MIAHHVRHEQSRQNDQGMGIGQIWMCDHGRTRVWERAKGQYFKLLARNRPEVGPRPHEKTVRPGAGAGVLEIRIRRYRAWPAMTIKRAYARP